MGSSDVPPPNAPAWLIPSSTALLGGGIGFWLLCYVLMVRRSLQTRDTPVPLLVLGVNLGWEIVYAFFVTEAWFEYLGFALWLLLDIPVVYTTLKFGKRSNSASPLVARNVPLLLALSIAYGVVANWLFAWWWLQEPHRGHGAKWGKTWKGLDARDTTELAWWSAGVAQLMGSAGALIMLLQRGHSGGQSYAIWFCRFVGTQLGLPGTCTLLWWYWPEAHGFVFHPVSLIIIGTSLACDLAYPLVLAQVRRTEKILPDGSVVAGEREAVKQTKKMQ